MQRDAQHGGADGGGALDGQIGRFRGLGLGPVAETAQRSVRRQNRADPCSQRIEPVVEIGAAQEGLEATFRVCAYVSGPVMMISLIPIVGGTIAPILQVVLLLTGLSRVHDTTARHIIGGWILMSVILGLSACGVFVSLVGGFAAFG